MALSPFAALSLPLAQDPAWRESAAGFGERLRAQLQGTAFSDGFQQKWQQVGVLMMCTRVCFVCCALRVHILGAVLCLWVAGVDAQQCVKQLATCCRETGTPLRSSCVHG